MKAFRMLFGSMLCFTLISGYSSPLMALSKRPPVPHDETGKFIPNPFAEADALRYGGLFGPLPAPEGDLFGSDMIFYPTSISRGIYPREIGFSVDEPHFIPITRVRSD